ncbi:urease accessory protein [Denitrobaculum tricleocarpae]|uniref:Urease accessory protein n=1 Tax=Denitrobaculum tricleocarpae TaxID=2591009 RepID=A0A545TF81_9PROT|nr:urease accessory protein [Denitrobaculum tricleocarpae]TQV75841.1 urease accessory protein [Denitrobaculum tricleocarpae]
MMGILGVGFLIGMQHALEADHVAAVSSIAARRSGVRDIVKHGVTWGVGHTLTLFLFAGAALALGATISEGMERWLEGTVGIMLILLGLYVIWRMLRDRVHFHVHRHDGGVRHIHAHSHRGETGPHSPVKHDHRHKHAAKNPGGIAWRSLFVGLIHGMAGSAALLVLVVSSVESPWIGLGYVMLFGAGSIVGMGLLSAAIAVPLVWSARAMTQTNHILQGAIGCITILVGSITLFESAGWI